MTLYLKVQNKSSISIKEIQYMIVTSCYVSPVVYTVYNTVFK